MRIHLVCFEKSPDGLPLETQRRIVNAFGSWARVTPTVYAARNGMPPCELRDALTDLVGVEGGVFVAEITDSHWACQRIAKAVTDRLKAWQQ